MTHFPFTTTHHSPPPPTTTTKCCSFTNFRPSPTNSFRLPKAGPAAFGYKLISSAYQITSTTARHRVVICMAKERRVKMVAKQIHREISDMLLTDHVLRHSVLPEAGLGADLYLSSVTTISDVELSNDLQSFYVCGKLNIVESGVGGFGMKNVPDNWFFIQNGSRIKFVKVFVSVFGDERGKEVAISGLKSKEKYVRVQLGKRMKLRVTPEIRFIEDESLESGSRVIAILDKLEEEEEEEKKKKKTAANDDEDDLDADFGDPEDEDPDEDIIYVE